MQAGVVADDVERVGWQIQLPPMFGTGGVRVADDVGRKP